MISQLNGVVIKSVADSHKGAYVVLDVHGVGYEVSTVPSVVYQVQAATEAQVAWTVYTQPVIREDHWQLVGFLRESERDMFTLLQQASGVGARMALAVMASLSVQEICQAIQHEQPEVLTVAKGVGPKLAKKMVLELKDKVRQWEHLDTLGDGVAAGTLVVGGVPEDVNDVLLSLGYTPAEIASVYRACVQDGTDALPDSESLLKQLLGALA